jgi:hypothetical protein
MGLSRAALRAGGGLDAGLIYRLHINLVHEPDHARLEAVRVWRRWIDPVDGRSMLARGRNAENLAFGRCELNHDQIVLILPIGCLTLGVEDSNDPQRDPLACTLAPIGFCLRGNSTRR